MDTGAQNSGCVVGAYNYGLSSLSILPIRARVCLVLSLTYGLSTCDLGLLLGMNARTLMDCHLKQLRKLHYVTLSSKFVWHVTAKGRSFVSSELARISLESSSLLDRVGSCSNARKDLAVVLAGYFPGVSGK